MTANQSASGRVEITPELLAEVEGCAAYPAHGGRVYVVEVGEWNIPFSRAAFAVVLALVERIRTLESERDEALLQRDIARDALKAETTSWGAGR